jgi:hypothetical protein
MEDFGALKTSLKIVLGNRLRRFLANPGHFLKGHRIA